MKVFAEVCPETEIFPSFISLETRTVSEAVTPSVIRREYKT